MAAIEILTKEDLEQFRQQLLQDIKSLMGSPGQQVKQLLKSAEVRKLLKISPGTLQNLRINGTLRYTRIGSIMYYKTDEINKLLEGNAKY
ncbi:helix-turn-helix domain-containing protein [Mucilaginibacter sp.]